MLDQIIHFVGSVITLITLLRIFKCLNVFPQLSHKMPPEKKEKHFGGKIRQNYFTENQFKLMTELHEKIGF